MRRLTLTLILLLTIPTTAQARVFTKAETRRTVREAAHFYHVPSRWIEDAAIDIIYTGVHPHIPDKDEARESNGDEKAGARKRCKGLLAFDPRWNPTGKTKTLAKKHGHELKDWKLCGECSIYRMVKSYQMGGRAAIRRGWRSTLGR